MVLSLTRPGGSRLRAHRRAQRRPQLPAATDEAVDDGFLLCQDAETIMTKASASTIGGSDEFAAAPKWPSRSSRAGG
ncbi:MAG: hypothetical protein EDR02_02435 [Actinobacteria bacterium]|nr:MAG: hypothetical protein EDR02_02435 [Actinomycetota bacterium]RIK07565.1 MAG: hypothetical protein DCC48_03445 [Acidobacteriota bacterium]